ncbi:MAG: glycosyltransferase [Acidimicrobiales bacterium]
MTEVPGRRIVAMVLTHNAPKSLVRCVEAICAQDERPDGLVVVDNASDPPVEASSIDAPGLSVRVLRSETNIGPAGGWALALRDFLDGEFTHAWLMDDDIVADPDCLATLWDAASDDPSSAFVVPISIQPDGSVGRYGSWCGFLIARDIVEVVGLPMAELFWWAEDTEYCHWRIPQAGFPRRVIDTAVVHHDAIRQGGDVPAWKYYYEARNMLYYHLYVMHKTGRYPRNVSRLVGRALFKQRSDRARCLAAVARGLYDGFGGRLGIRYPVTPLNERHLATPTGAGPGPPGAGRA